MADKSELFVNKQSGGMHVVTSERTTTGDIFFVNSATGVDAATHGRHPDAPYASLAYAGLLATLGPKADRQDIIYLMPGHTETVSAAGDLVLDIAGISIIGLGHGTLIPTITLDTIITADIDIDAARITIENIVIESDFVDVDIAIDVNADDFTIRNCRFQATAGNNFQICIEDAAAGGSDRITVEDCIHIDRDVANTHFINLTGTGDGHVIRNNVLMGDYGTICIGGAGVVTNIIIAGNAISNTAAVNDSCINLAAATTGIVVNNLCGGGAAVTNGITATACTIAENYYQLDTADLSGLLDPVAT